MKYVIIGNSAAGLACAEEIRKHDSEGSVTIVSDEYMAAYSRPLISYFLKDKVTEDIMKLRTTQHYEDLNIDVMLGTRALNIDTTAKTIALSNSEKLYYDKLMLATGSIPFIPQIEGLHGKENVYTFLDIASSKAIKEVISPETRAVVLGGGLIGMKAAEGLNKVCSSVTVIEMADRLLPTILDYDASEIVRKHISEKGIQCILEDTIMSVEGDMSVASVTLRSGKRLPCDLLVIGVGVRPCVELAETIGAEVKRGIVTDEHMMTSVPDVFAGGDCVVSHDVTDGNDKILALWCNAVEQGKVAGASMAGAKAEFDGAFAMNAIDFYGTHMITAGTINPTEDSFEPVIHTDGRNYRKLVIKDGMLKGYILMGNVERAGMYTELIRSCKPLSELDSSILEDISLFAYSKAERDVKIFGGEK